MPFGGISMWGPLALSAGSSIFGGLFGKSAAEKAAEKQQQSADTANKYIQGNTNITRDQINNLSADARNRIDSNTQQANGLFSPYTQVGSTAAGGLNTALQNPFQFNLQDDPGYQFRLQQGQKAVEQSAAARGGAVSGGALKALTQYGQGFASDEYGNAFARHQQQLQNLFQGAGLGLSASNTESGNLNQNSALQNSVIGDQLGLNAGLTEQNNQLIGNNITGAGNANAAGIVGGANALGSAAQGIGQTANQLFLLNLLKNPGGNGATPSFNPGSGPGYGYGPGSIYAPT